MGEFRSAWKKLIMRTRSRKRWIFYGGSEYGRSNKCNVLRRKYAVEGLDDRLEDEMWVLKLALNEDVPHDLRNIPSPYLVIIDWFMPIIQIVSNTLVEGASYNMYDSWRFLATFRDSHLVSTHNTSSLLSLDV